MKQKFALLLSACLLSAALTACGRDTNTPANDNGTATQQPSTAQDTMDSPNNPNGNQNNNGQTSGGTNNDPLMDDETRPGTSNGQNGQTGQTGRDDGLLDDMEDDVETDIDRMMQDGQLGVDRAENGTSNGTMAETSTPDSAAR